MCTKDEKVGQVDRTERTFGFDKKDKKKNPIIKVQLWRKMLHIGKKIEALSTEKDIRESPP